MPASSDLEVFGPDGNRVLAVEIKAGSLYTADITAEWRRNMIRYGGVPPADYFMVVTGANVFLWIQRGTEQAELRPPDASGPTVDLIGHYLDAVGLDSKRIEEATLELAVAAWLGKAVYDALSDAPGWLTATGLIDAVRGGDVRVPIAA